MLSIAVATAHRYVTDAVVYIALFSSRPRKRGAVATHCCSQYVSNDPNPELGKARERQGKENPRESQRGSFNPFLCRATRNEA